LVQRGLARALGVPVGNIAWMRRSGSAFAFGGAHQQGALSLGGPLAWRDFAHNLEPIFQAEHYRARTPRDLPVRRVFRPQPFGFTGRQCSTYKE
jgi:hypothetical protein